MKAAPRQEADVCRDAGWGCRGFGAGGLTVGTRGVGTSPAQPPPSAASNALTSGQGKHFSAT